MKANFNIFIFDYLRGILGHVPLEDVLDVLAVMEQETDFEAFFRPGSKQLEKNLEAAAKYTGLSKEYLRSWLQTPQGIPKFRFSEHSWKWAKELKVPQATIHKFMISCSFGYGQKLMRWYLLEAKVPPEKYSQYVDTFINDPTLQLKVLLKDLKKHPGKSKELYFSKYNLSSITEPTDYGKEVYKYYLELKQIAKDLKLV